MQLSRLTNLIHALALALCCAAAGAAEDEASPFRVAPSVTNLNGQARLVVSIQIPPQHRLYASALTFEINGSEIPFELPPPASIADRHSGKDRQVFTNSFEVSHALPPGASSLAINLHGCNDEECYFPETRQWRILQNLSLAAVDNVSTTASATNMATGFVIAARTTGFQGAAKFLEFLSDPRGREANAAPFAGMGTAAIVGVILLGGMALNLTPCVLPMIPINLAILGAGATHNHRRRGFILGASYGGGIALAYGALGVIVVITGSKFGTLNSSAWFNFAIAAVFVVLGLAMLDRINIDLSRFQRRSGQRSQGPWAWIGVATMGAVSALLAGACVAPVVISVLLLAATLHQQGNFLGLMLPFILGIGMALPWPFAAAGLSFLPKPGAWMIRVKHGFAILIFGFALWYGSIGWSLARPLHASAREEAGAEKNVATLRAALNESQATGRPVLIDFWASWCKNCAAMEQTTLHDASVRKRLDDFIVVKFQAEHLNDSTIKPVLDEFGVLGLPTFVLLKPKEQHTPGPLSAR